MSHGTLSRLRGLEEEWVVHLGRACASPCSSIAELFVLDEARELLDAAAHVAAHRRRGDSLGDPSG